LQHYPDTTVIIADDGLQHLALGRDIEIAVQDTRGIGNGRLLPAGPLREPASRLERVDYLVLNAPAGDAAACGDVPSPPVNSGGTPVRQIVMQLHPTRIVHLQSGRAASPSQWVSEHQEQSVVAIAGIGHPPRFFRTL